MAQTLSTGVNSPSCVRKDKYGRRIYKNRISAAMTDYREDYRYNPEWWKFQMGAGRNNEYLWIQYKNGDSVMVDYNYFEENAALPRFRADEVEYISRYFGDQIETTTAANIEIDTNRITLYHDGVEYFRYEMTEAEYKELRKQIYALDDDTNATAWMLDYCRALATSRMDNATPTETSTPNSDSAMNANNVPEINKEEYTPAAYCLDVYLMNESEIYNRYTVPAINAVVEAVKRNGWQLPKEEVIKNLTFWTSWQDGTKKALQAAARLVKKYGHMTPTAKDIEQVTRNYAAYIVDCAKYEIEK